MALLSEPSKSDGHPSLAHSLMLKRQNVTAVSLLSVIPMDGVHLSFLIHKSFMDCLLSSECTKL